MAESILGFTLTADDPAPKDSSPGSQHWRQSDIDLALAAAKQADLQDFRIELAPDGTISIIVGQAPEAGPREPD